MKRCLLLSSLLLLAGVASAAGWLLPLDGRQQFAVSIAARGVMLTGICVVSTDSAGYSRGSVVNEFGIHAFDFTVGADRRRVRLLNVVPQLDRWYLRRVVRGDLRRLFLATATGRQKGHRTVSLSADGTVVLVNERHNLEYGFKRIESYEVDE